MANDDYLWDRSGPPDLEVARLERTLAKFRAPEPKRRRVMYFGIAAAAAVALFVLRPPQPSEWRWDERALRVGDVVQPVGTVATLRAPDVGQVELEPGSRLRVAKGGRDLALDVGTMRAFIYAPPARFVVDTPSARAVDLGCLYTLKVEPDGSGLLRVDHGWVAFEANGKESFVPAGAYCRTTAADGPGLPVFEDSPAGFRAAVDSRDIDAMLASAGHRDGLTLWHLLSRVGDAEREQVVRTFARIVPKADAAGLRAGNPAALDAAWNLLELGDTGWWRTWKRDWRP
jgi:hypothetical protein